VTVLADGLEVAGPCPCFGEGETRVPPPWVGGTGEGPKQAGPTVQPAPPAEWWVEGDGCAGLVSTCTAAVAPPASTTAPRIPRKIPAKRGASRRVRSCPRHPADRGSRYRGTPRGGSISTGRLCCSWLVSQRSRSSAILFLPRARIRHQRDVPQRGFRNTGSRRLRSELDQQLNLRRAQS